MELEMPLDRESAYDTYSDLHKDVYGYRPRDWDRIRKMTDDELDEEFKFLQKELDESIRQEIIVKEQNDIDFEAHLHEVSAKLGGVSIKDVLRWEMQADGDDPTSDNDVTSWLWSKNLTWEKEQYYRSIILELEVL